MIFPLTFKKVWLILIQINMYCQWIQTDESHEHKFYDKIGDLSLGSFWYHNNHCTKNEVLRK